MKRTIHFTKMHGLGNDYVYINSDLYPLTDPSAFSIKYSDRRKGIGGDGLILYGKGEEETYEMRIFNIDGSEGLMCGNAIRCVAKLLYQEGLDRSREMEIRTASGSKYLSLTIGNNDEVESVRVDMNPPRIINEELKLETSNGWQVVGQHVDVGNPHLVQFVSEDLTDFPLEVVGPEVEESELFQPHKVNYEIARVVDPHTIEMRVWERGSGMTMACGTGACATAVAAIHQGLGESPIEVKMPGGDLVIEWSGDQEEPVYMTGDATLVYRGELTI
ncbi:MAG: diaminopimelate epimerase [Porphyromonas sp.]|nr:diaminopimelate epimerase [Porphyromonas sp.]